MIITPEKNKNLLKTLVEFGYAEYGSALEMLMASKKTKSTKLKIGYIRHAIDEYRHTNLIFKVLDLQINNKIGKFEKEFRFQPKNVVSKGYVDKDGFLIEKLKIKNFVEFVYANEFLAKEAFKNLKTSISDTNSLEILTDIMEEEDGHADEALTTLDMIMIDEDKHWGYAKSYYEKTFPNSLLKIAFLREKFKNRMRLFYLKNVNFLTKIFDPMAHFMIKLFGKIVLLIEIPDLNNKNLMHVKKASLL